jgi:hypothetical protein
MKRTTIWIWAAVALLVLPFQACKKAEVETGSLSVQLSAGVSGTPAAGSYTLNVGDTVSYSYALEPGFSKLTVLLNEQQVAASGTVTISGSHFLKAYSDDNLEYKLTVQMTEGVTGSPAAGTYYYKAGTVVPYAYAMAEGYKGFNVKLNGSDVAASGSVTLNQDSVLYVGAAVKQDVRGSWILSEAYGDGSSFTVTVTFSGTLFSGTVSDSEGGVGTYDYSDDSLDFTLVFPDVTYKYSDGEFTDTDTMSGKCQRYQAESSAVSGTWTAARVTSGAAGTQSGGSKNKSRN